MQATAAMEQKRVLVMHWEHWDDSCLLRVACDTSIARCREKLWSNGKRGGLKLRVRVSTVTSLAICHDISHIWEKAGNSGR